MTEVDPRGEVPAPGGPTSGDSASRRRRLRWRYVVLAVACAGAVVWMLTLLQGNVVFFKTVSAAVQDQGKDGTRTMRVGGAVVPGSIQRNTEGIDFELTEGGATVRVHHVGSEPALFKDCAPVVAEGRWDATTTNAFDSSRLLIKHDNNYEAPPSGAVECPKDPFKS